MFLLLFHFQDFWMPKLSYFYLRVFSFITISLKTRWEFIHINKLEIMFRKGMGRVLQYICPFASECLPDRPGVSSSTVEFSLVFPGISSLWNLSTGTDSQNLEQFSVFHIFQVSTVLVPEFSLFLTLPYFSLCFSVELPDFFIYLGVARFFSLLAVTLGWSIGVGE